MPLLALRAAAPIAAVLALTAAPITASAAPPAPQASLATAAFTRTPSERCPATGRLTFRALTVPWWDTLTLRAKPSTASPAVTDVAGYWHVRSLTRGTTWSKVSFDGTTGWIRTADLSRTRHTYRCTPGAWVSHPQSPAEGA